MDFLEVGHHTLLEACEVSTAVTKVSAPVGAAGGLRMMVGAHDHVMEHGYAAALEKFCEHAWRPFS